MKKWILLFAAMMLVHCGDDSASASDQIDDDSHSSSKEKSSDEKSGSTSKKSSSSQKKSSSSSSGKNSSKQSSSSQKSSSNSSSSQKKSSSSTKAASSSSKKREFSYFVENEEMSFDLKTLKLTDKRDGQVYDIEWKDSTVIMVKNLNYDVENSCCYNDYAPNCERYGRLYRLSAARGHDLSLTNDGPSQGACPLEWRNDVGYEPKIYGGWMDNEYKSFKGLGTQAVFFTHTIGGIVNATGDAAYIITAPSTPNDTVSWKYYSLKTYSYASLRCRYEWHVVAPEGVTPPKSKVSFDEYKIPEKLPTYAGEYGELVDERDGNVYKTVQIGKQVWMAENLRFVIDSSFCLIVDDVDSCGLGRMYKWPNANNLAYSFNRDTIEWPIQGVCPNGWHIPTKSDWRELFDFVLDKTNGFYVDYALRSTDWGDSIGRNSFGFNVIPSGNYHIYDGHKYRTDLYGSVYFMVSDERTSDPDRWVAVFYYPSAHVEARIRQETQYRVYPQIRCIKGEGSRPILPVDSLAAKK